MTVMTTLILSFQADKYTSYAGVQYSPLDMAEYIFWTGDEKGVTLAIEEFLQDGLVSATVCVCACKTLAVTRCCIPRRRIVDVVLEWRRDSNHGLRLDGKGWLTPTSNSFVERRVFERKSSNSCAVKRTRAVGNLTLVVQEEITARWLIRIDCHSLLVTLVMKVTKLWKSSG